MISEHSNGQPKQAVAEPHRFDSPPSRHGGLGWLWAILILAAVCAGGYFIVPRFLPAKSAGAGAPGGSGKGPKGPGVIPVIAAKAKVGDLSIFLNGLGSVTALQTVAIHTRVDGQLDKVLYTEGQIVKEGDLLAEIDPRPFQVQLTVAQGSLIRDQALLNNAQHDLDRYVKLLAQNLSVTQQQVDTQRALVAQYDGAVKTDQGNVDSAQLNITYAKVTAPITGRIGLRLVDVGNIVHANDANPLAVITQIQPIAVVFTIAEDNIPAIMNAMKTNAMPPVEAWDRDLTHKIADGTLLAVDNQVDPTNGTVKIKAQYKNENFELYPNEFVNARLLVQTLKKQILIPAAAVQRGPNNKIFVYIVKPDQTVDLRDVEMGPTEGDQTVILSGLSADELVVTDGVDKLVKDGKVTVRERNKRGGTTQPSTSQPGTSQPGTSQPGATQPAPAQSARELSTSTTQPDGVAHPHHHKAEKEGAE